MKQPVFIRRPTEISSADLPDQDYFGYNVKLRRKPTRDIVNFLCTLVLILCAIGFYMAGLLTWMVKVLAWCFY